MRTEVLSIKLPLHEAAMVRRQAANLGLTKSSYGANLLMRGLEAEATVSLPNVFDKMQYVLERMERLMTKLEGDGLSSKVDYPPRNNPERRAFMIEVLLLLRHFARDDLKVKGEIGRKIQKAVGDMRVEGT
jgi:hypothetical protein